MSVVGFQFGTTNCYIAIARAGGIETVANEYSDRCTPAFISFNEKNRFIGHAAKQQVVTHLKNTITNVRRLIGRKFDDNQVQQERAWVPFDIVQGPNGVALVQTTYLGQSRQFYPEQLAAMLLGKLKSITEIGTRQKVTDCVISVPCFATDAERRAMLAAASVAGLNCLRLMNETTAIALAYGIYKQDLPADDQKPRVVVFIDMGYATLQVFAVAFNKAKLKMLATTFDNFLGGRDLDKRMVDHFSDEFKKKYNLDVRSNPRATLRLFAECEKLRKLMSANQTAIPLNIECFMNDKDVSSAMKRVDFEASCGDLFKRVENTILAVLKEANLKPADVEAVEIVGGCTRVPAVKEVITRIFGKEPSTTLNADEAVARGCALQCAILSPTFRVRDFGIQDCQLFPINVSWKGATANEDSEIQIFTKWGQIPMSKMLTFHRREPFTIEARYAYPNDIPFHESIIGHFVVNNVVPQANGDASKIKVKVRVNNHGVFSVTQASLVEKLDSKDDGMETEEGGKADALPEEQQKKQDAKQSEETAVPNGDASGEKGKSADDQGHTAGDAAGKGDAPAKADAEKEAETAKKAKSKVKHVDLPIVPRLSEFSKEEINGFVEVESQMMLQDKVEKEKADAKNAVEEYVYEMRDRLGTTLESFVSDDVRHKFTCMLEDTENWLYDEGEEQAKRVYEEKLLELRKLGEPIKNRAVEAENRPRAFEELGRCLQLVRKALSVYQAKDEQYSHIEPADMEKVAKALSEKERWFEEKFNLQNRRPAYEDPIVLVDQILTEAKLLNDVCQPILNKPKPKPPPPPVEEKPEEKNGTAKADGGTTATGETMDTS